MYTTPVDQNPLSYAEWIRDQFDGLKRTVMEPEHPKETPLDLVRNNSDHLTISKRNRTPTK